MKATIQQTRPHGLYSKRPIIKDDNGCLCVGNIYRKQPHDITKQEFLSLKEQCKDSTYLIEVYNGNL